MPGDEVNHYYTLTYDAWNRLVKVQDDQGTPATVAEYRYDGTNRRIRKYTDKSGDDWTVREFYYNASWQALEVSKDTKARVGGAEPDLAAPAYEQYVWSARYIDAPVLRDRNNDQDPDLEERLYYATDANMNVTTLVGTEGAVAERYTYDPYGKATFRDADWSEITWANSKQNEVLYCGYRFDPETGLYHVRRRPYHPTVGRWVSRDPMGYADGMGLYLYCSGRPTVVTDSAGLGLIGPGDPLFWNEPLSFDIYRYLFGTPAPCPVCGPEVKGALVDALDRLIAWWGQPNRPRDEKWKCCKAVNAFPAGLGAWDIDLLHGQAWIRGYQSLTPPCAVGKRCEDTVQVDGKCYYAGSVNYVLFGHMFRLCQQFMTDEAAATSPPNDFPEDIKRAHLESYAIFTEARMLFLIRAYKGPGPSLRGLAENYETSVAWARAGYHDWPRGGPQPPPERPECSFCTHVFQGEFDFTWRPGKEPK